MESLNPPPRPSRSLYPTAWVLNVVGRVWENVCLPSAGSAAAEPAPSGDRAAPAPTTAAPLTSCRRDTPPGLLDPFCMDISPLPHRRVTSPSTQHMHIHYEGQCRGELSASPRDTPQIHQSDPPLMSNATGNRPSGTEDRMDNIAV